MSSVITETTGWEEVACIQLDFSKILEGEGGNSIFTIYNMFIAVNSVLALFFAISLILAIKGAYFLTWTSASIGLFGTLTLSLVGWFSKKQIHEVP